ncbi:UNVERIFIED_CONTAM: hypothetical protein Sradi_4756500 [Sesamum radiatum]|uniref:Transposase n=1 Tax=Sesamum radiatum TaxID=300843 RepID=A0AAW2MWA8_SESRA
MGEILPCDHTFSLDYYHTKKLITELGLSVVKIDACKNDCMLYWKDDIKFESCKFCGDPRYKLQKAQNYQVTKSAYTVLRYLPLTPRLQRLYASLATVQHMTWHASHKTKEGSMIIPQMPRHGDILIVHTHISQWSHKM